MKSIEYKDRQAIVFMPTYKPTDIELWNFVCECHPEKIIKRYSPYKVGQSVDIECTECTNGGGIIALKGLTQYIQIHCPRCKGTGQTKASILDIDIIEVDEIYNETKPGNGKIMEFADFIYDNDCPKYILISHYETAEVTG